MPRKKTWKCGCDKRFGTEAELQVHVKSLCRGVQCSCGRCFKSAAAARTHRAVKPHVQCTTCSRIVLKHLSVHEDHAAVSLPVPINERERCEYCWKTFDTVDHVESHMLYSHTEYTPEDHNPVDKFYSHCRVCSRAFRTPDALQQHIDMIHEAHCCDCNRDFLGKRAMDNHCCGCGVTFGTHEALNHHLSLDPHARDELTKTYCHKCDRNFKEPKALQQHLASLAHNPLSSVPCPFGKCKKVFRSPAALVQHLESGSCKSGVARQQINSLIIQHDTDRLITTKDAAQMLETFSNNQATLETNIRQAPALQEPESDDSSVWSESWAGCLTPSSHGSTFEILDGVSGGVPLPPSGIDEPFEIIRNSSFDVRSLGSTDDLLDSVVPTPTSSRRGSSVADSTLALDRSSLHCPLCPSSRPAFRSPTALRKHLDSLQHAPRIFHCPTGLVPTRKPGATPRSFASLSALTQHLQSGACEGGRATLEVAVEFVQKRLEEFGFGGVKLLL